MGSTMLERTIAERQRLLRRAVAEALLASLHSRWIPRLEVAVYRPVRGVIDIVLQDRESGDVVAGEGHSVLHSVERQVRWAGQKADALVSARERPWSDRPDQPPIGRLLLLRSTEAMRNLAQTVPVTFETAYPARTADAVEALTTSGRPWPGHAIIRVQVDGAATRLLAGPPRGVRT